MYHLRFVACRATSTNQSPASGSKNNGTQRNHNAKQRNGNNAGPHRTRKNTLSNDASTRSKEEGDNPCGPQRIAKALAQAGVASRRASEALVKEGRVAVNGATITTPVTLVTPGVDQVEVDGKHVDIVQEPRVYFVLNKPKGWICSSDTTNTSATAAPLLRDTITAEEAWGGKPRNRKNTRQPNSARVADGGEGATASLNRRVIDLFSEYLTDRWPRRHPDRPMPRLFTVGRLDVATTGLLVVTNDGDLTNRISHPRNELTREYLVTLNRDYTRADVKTIAEGVNIDGAVVAPLEVLPVRGDGPMDRNTRKLTIVVSEGRNREVRRLVEGAGKGLEVKRLKRVRVGALRLPPSLREGHFVELKADEAYNIASLKGQERGGRVLWQLNRLMVAAPSFRRSYDEYENESANVNVNVEEAEEYFD